MARRIIPKKPMLPKEAIMATITEQTAKDGSVTYKEK